MCLSLEIRFYAEAESTADPEEVEDEASGLSSRRGKSESSANLPLAEFEKFHTIWLNMI
jgi:hypothetical protein